VGYNACEDARMMCTGERGLACGSRLFKLCRRVCVRVSAAVYVHSKALTAGESEPMMSSGWNRQVRRAGQKERGGYAIDAMEK